MASPSASSSSSSHVLSPTVTQEEFKIFHNIDRILYSRLVFDLNRDPAESMHVMAFWIWLERARHVGDLVYRMLSVPDTLVNSLADEAVICLNCIRNDQFHLSFDRDIPLIHCLSKTGLSLQFLHENRLFALRAVSKIFSQVCLRAFEDIQQQVEELKFKALVDSRVVGNIPGKETTKKQPCTPYVRPVTSPALPVLYNSNVAGGGYSGLLHGFDSYDLAVQTKILNNEIVDMLSHLQICSDEVKDNVIPADDRTIFLTFSKGYPISEDEIRDFFTRKYGEFIEAIHMQEVAGDEEQPLYARLVVQYPSAVTVILEDKSKAKFSINGKHVWARKYVRKSPRSPPSQPTSPAPPSQALLY